jgi:glycosyltransferase involved in cell wall biosynthesis
LTLSNQVVTIHDASTLDHPEWFERKFAAWYQYLLPRLVRRVRRVLTVSEFSRERLLAISGVAPEKIVAIPLGVSEDFKPSTGEEIASLRQRFSLERPYVLALGSLEPRKNLKGLFAAWQILLSTNQDCELVVVGDRGRVFRDQGFEKVPEKVRFLGYVDNKDLPALYSGARIFIFPSLYEGFGLPPLEAMACGCPVIVSKTASLPEVCGNACLYCDPYQPEGIAEQMEQIVQDDSLRSKLSEKGMDRASEFSWDRTAERTWKILSEYL